MVYKYKGLQLKDRRLRRKLKNLSLTFTRSGVAYDYQGNSVPENTPRFTHLINGVLQQGCLIEEAHTNLCTAEASLSISHASPYTTGTLNGTYTFQCEGTGSYVLSGGATGTVSKDNPVTAAVSSATVTLTPATTSTLNQIIKLGYPLSWVLGGTTQNAETLTAPSSVLNIDTQGYSNLLTANQADGTDTSSTTTGFSKMIGTETISSSTEQYSQGSRSLKVVTPGNVVNEGVVVNETTTVSGVVYTYSFKIYADVGATLNAVVYNHATSSLALTAITGTGGWQTISVTATANDAGVKLMIMTRSSARNYTFYVDELQLSATSSAKPWIPGGTQSNNGTGTIEMETVITPALASNTASVNLLYHGTTATQNVIQLARYNGSWYFTTGTNTATKTQITYAQTLTNGTTVNLAFPFSNTGSKGFINGSSVGTPSTAPSLPSGVGTLSIGHYTAGYANGIYRNVTVSLPKRADTDVTNRNTQNVNGVGFKVDKEIKLVAPLKTNLNAYRVKA